ncbi:hypothetical protein PUV54_08325 [Hyphococcus flavus]|uniref:Uncharacterized protein n=1 Tax=Hyphococcus flavus TaxID=1866326 RepID=A0AAE9ZL90_9PROT|nr:hypothetical protein [Hyphococcus flavus]WDI33201.1 hypothetical protein PUV54_08325 [Hyphococcus flavus]
MLKTSLSISAAVVAGMAGSFTMAQGLSSNLLECRSIADDARRLACFDQAVVGLSDVTADAQSKPESNISVAEALSPEEKFGREDLPETKEQIQERREKELRQLTAKVAEIAENRRGKYVFILENGQVWRQLSSDTNKLLLPNDEEVSVEIKRRFLGAHSLSLVDDNRSVRVERIK